MFPVRTKALIAVPFCVIPRPTRQLAVFELAFILGRGLEAYARYEAGKKG
jgi:hypothetical protein